MTSQPLFDPKRDRLHRRRAHRMAIPGADFLLRHAAAELVERVGVVQRSFSVAADIGSATPHLASSLADLAKVDRVWRVDDITASRPDVVASPEVLPLAPESVDLIVGALALHAVNDLPGSLVQMRQALKPDGLLSIALAGGDTLSELREALVAAEADVTGGAAPRVAPMAGLSDLAGLLQRAGFALPVADRETLTVRYGSVRALLRDLRAMGATNALATEQPRPLTRSILDRCEALYAERFADNDGRLRATFELHYLAGWAPHASQQKPLRPGEAQARLADALGTVERPAGEKTGR